MDEEYLQETLRELYAMANVHGALIEHLLADRLGTMPRKRAKTYADTLASAMDAPIPPSDLNEREEAHFADARARTKKHLKAAVARALDAAHGLQPDVTH